MIINPNLPYGFVVFCDDVRHEITGKDTVVGAYGPQMMFRVQPPVSIPQLSVITWYRFAAENAPSSVEFRLVYETEGGETTTLDSATIDLSDRDFHQVPSNFVDKHALSYSEVRNLAHVRNLTFTQAGRLKSRIYFDDNELRVGTLGVSFQDAVGITELK
jgi:hypothetical protein